jgi:hypothetical protein
MGLGSEIRHESDKEQYPERHWLTKESYTKEEAHQMCFRCNDHYEWNKKMEYNPMTDTFYKIKN